MSNNNNYELGRFKRILRFLSGKRRTIMLIGYSGSGKTTVLKALEKRDNVSDDDMKRVLHTPGFIRHDIEYETTRGEKLYIKSDDSEGLEKAVYTEEFKKRIKMHQYIVYLLNVNAFVNGHDVGKNELCKSWLQEVSKLANKKTMMLVLTHADEYLASINKEYNDTNKVLIRKLFLGGEGYLSDVKFRCSRDTIVANVRKYDEVRKIIEDLIRPRN